MTNDDKDVQATEGQDKAAADVNVAQSDDSHNQKLRWNLG
jgi:hypothetical protein